MSGSILACRKIKRKRKMKRTKIICTMGPNTNDKKLMKDMAIAGMDVARFNFSHGDYEEHLGRLNILREVREETGKEVAALLDTKGPEIRTGLLEGGNKVTLVAGNEYTLTINECVGNDKKGFINYSGLNEDVKAGDKILIDDGLIALDLIIRTAHTVSLRTSALYHKSVYYSVESKSVIKLLIDKAYEVSYSVRCHFRVELDFDYRVIRHCQCYYWIFHMFLLFNLNKVTQM